MSIRILPRTLAALTFVFISGAGAQEAPAPPPQAPPASEGTAPGGARPGPGEFPGTQNPRQPRFPQDPRENQPFPDQQRMIYISGKVVMEDGTPPPDQVIIERMCGGGNARPEGYTDSKGRFSFQLGQNNAMLADASVSSVNDQGFGGGGMAGSRGSGGFGQSRGVNERDLMGCELRASLAGFRSESVNLSGRRMLDNPDVGTIVLRRLAKVDGFTFSGTSAFAPKDARKAFDKGREANKKKKYPDAERELQKAVATYPKYAAAWYELGVVYQLQRKLEEAKNAYAESIKADEKFVSPYAQLARLAAVESKWQDAADYSSRLVRLNPYYSPDAYFYSALANLNLNKLEAAEEHAREALKMDAQHRNPKINHLLGVILAQRADYPAAAENMRDYLRFSPDATDADAVKKQLAEVEKLIQGATPAGTNQN